MRGFTLGCRLHPSHAQCAPTTTWTSAAGTTDARLCKGAWRDGTASRSASFSGLSVNRFARDAPQIFAGQSVGRRFCIGLAHQRTEERGQDRVWRKSCGSGLEKGVEEENNEGKRAECRDSESIAVLVGVSHVLAGIFSPPLSCPSHCQDLAYHFVMNIRHSPASARWASQYGVVFTDIPVFMTLAAFLFVSYNNMSACHPPVRPRRTPISRSAVCHAPC